MKQLTCEMCGSIDLIKQDGVFVCQTCGTKYSIEEAKKMMIEGTVKIDKTSEVENLTKRMFDLLDQGRLVQARECSQKILDIDVENGDACLGELMSQTYCELASFNDHIGLHIQILTSSKFEIIKQKSSDKIKELIKKIEKDYVKIDGNNVQKDKLNFVYNKNRYMKLSNCSSISKRAFYYCWELESIEIPSSVTSIGQYAFYGCEKLKNITLPFVGATLNGCKNTEFAYIFGSDWNVPNSLKEVVITGGSNIGDDAFRELRELESIIIPNSVTSIDNSAFSGCENLKKIIIDGDSKLKSIGKCAFSSCVKLTNITIPDSVTSIGDFAFYNCMGLKEVALDENSKLYAIGENAFAGCGRLENIKIPSSVVNVAVNAFSGCKHIERGFIQCLIEKLEKEEKQLILQISKLRDSKQDVPSLRLQVKMQKEIEVLEKTKKTMIFRFKAKKEIEEKINELSNRIYENNVQVGAEWRKIENKVNATIQYLQDVRLRIEKLKNMKF